MRNAALPRWNIAAGELRQRAVLQTSTVGTPNSQGTPKVVWPWDVAIATWAASVGTITTAAAHGLRVGDGVTVGGMLPAAWNGAYRVASVVNATRFTVAIASNPGTAVKLGRVVTDPAIGTPVRCAISTLSGRKGEIAKQLVPSATHLIVMRYRSLNEKTQRLVYKTGRVFNVERIDDVDERHVRLELLCTEEKVPA